MKKMPNMSKRKPTIRPLRGRCLVDASGANRPNAKIGSRCCSARRATRGSGRKASTPTATTPINITGNSWAANSSIVQLPEATAATRYVAPAITPATRPRSRTGIRSTVRLKVTGTPRPSANEAKTIQATKASEALTDGATTVKNICTHTTTKMSRSFTTNRVVQPDVCSRTALVSAVIQVRIASKAIVAATSGSVSPTNRVPRSTSPSCTSVIL